MTYLIEFLIDLIPNVRLRWMVGTLLFAILDMVVFIGCLLVENTQCATITGLLAVIALCILAWHTFIYIAAKRSGL